jgi:hypothetical protein
MCMNRTHLAHPLIYLFFNMLARVFFYHRFMRGMNLIGCTFIH